VTRRVTPWHRAALVAVLAVTLAGCPANVWVWGQALGLAGGFVPATVTTAWIILGGAAAVALIVRSTER